MLAPCVTTYLPRAGQVQEHRIRAARQLRREALLLHIALAHGDQAPQAIPVQVCLCLLCAHLCANLQTSKPDDCLMMD